MARTSAATYKHTEPHWTKSYERWSLAKKFHLIVEKPHPVDGGQMRVVKILKQTVHQLFAVVNLLKGQD